MFQKISLIISQNDWLRFLLQLFGDIVILLLIIYVALLATGEEINFVYANF